MDVDALAQEIRRVDGSNSLGAGALAERLMPFIEADTRDLLATTAGLRQKLERVTQERDHWMSEARRTLKAGQDALDRAERAETDNARLRSALEPFARLAGAVFRVDEDGRMMNATKADEASIWGFDREEITYGDLRAARQATEAEASGQVEAAEAEKEDRFAYWNSLSESAKAEIRQGFRDDMYGGTDD